jgi:hypothetical protein
MDGFCRKKRAASANSRAGIFLLDRLQACDKHRKIPSRRFGPAQADATTRWKWRRKPLKKLVSAMEMARSSSAHGEEKDDRIEATKGEVLPPNALKSRDDWCFRSLAPACAVPTDRDLLSASR